MGCFSAVFGWVGYEFHFFGCVVVFWVLCLVGLTCWWGGLAAGLFGVTWVGWLQFWVSGVCGLARGGWFGVMAYFVD